MANNVYPHWEPSSLNCEFNHKESVEAQVGDALYFDYTAGALYPASSLADAGAATQTQQMFARLFAGISKSRQLASDSTARRADVLIDVVMTVPCTSATFEVGDYITPTYTAGVLSNQSYTKTNNPTMAVARVVKRYASATTKVKARFRSNLLIGPFRAPPTNATRTTIADAGTITVAQLKLLVLYQDASGGNVTMTTPTGTAIDAAYPGIATGHVIPLHVASNHATNTSTISGGTGVTLVGSGAVTQLGGSFLFIKTGTATYDLVRVG